jgi:hypothetical protein
MKKLKVMIFISIFVCSGQILQVFCQDKPVVEKVEIPELELNNVDFEHYLDSLLTVERQCITNDSSMYWAILFDVFSSEKARAKVTQYGKTPRNEVLQISKIYGYLFIDDVFYVIYNTPPVGMFLKTDTKTIFNYHNNPFIDENPFAFLIDEEFSEWFFLIQKNKITLERGYSLSCDKE